MQAKEKTLVIGEPLIKKVWISIHPAIHKTVVEDSLDAFFFRNTDLYDAQVNIKVRDDVQECVDLILSTILYARNFRVSKDRSFPRTNIYVPCFQVDEHFVSSVDAIDHHEPRIQVFLTVSEEDIARAQVAEKIDQIVALLQDRRIDCRVLFIIEENLSSLRAMLSTIEKMFFQNPIEVEPYAFHPMLEINPYVLVSNVQEAVDLLLDFLSTKPEVLQAATEGPSGLLSLLFRVKALHSLNERSTTPSVVPILSCAAGSPTRWFSTKQKSIASHCFHAPIYLFPQTIVNDFVRNRCVSCEYVEYCGTCSVSLMSSGKCHLYTFIKSVLTRFSENSKLIDALTPVKPLAGILALDWDYIFDY
jgi:hypothetical protein